MNKNSTGTQGFGGGIYAENGSMVNVTKSSVNQNGEPYEGGGIYTYESTLTIDHSQVSGNQTISTGLVYGGGGIWMQSSDVSINGSQVTGNSSADYGGGIAYYGSKGGVCVAVSYCGSTNVGLTVTGSNIDHNTATDSGGGIYNDAESGDTAVTLDHSSVSFNTVTDGDGGGISNYGHCGNTATLNASLSSLLGNHATAGEGGAIYNSNGDICPEGQVHVTLSHVQVGTSNGPNLAEYGAGIFNENGDGQSTVTLQQATAIVRNRASIDGGGVYNCPGAVLNVLSAAIINNIPDNVVNSLSCP